MGQIDTINQRLETYTEDVEDIKAKIKEVAENKGITIEMGVDTPLSVLTKIDNGTIPSST